MKTLAARRRIDARVAVVLALVALMAAVADSWLVDIERQAALLGKEE